MSTQVKASASETLAVWMVVIAACLGFWAIVIMGIIRIIHELPV